MLVKIKLISRFRKVYTEIPDCKTLIEVRDWFNNSKNMISIGDRLLINQTTIVWIKPCGIILNNIIGD